MASSTGSGTPRREPEDTPVTQILYIDIDPARDLEDESTREGRLWAEMLDLIQDSPGFERLYWGRRLEEPEKVQVHTVRDTLDAHKSFLASSSFQQDLTTTLRRLTTLPLPSTTPTTTPNTTTAHAGPPTGELPLNVRHAYLAPLALSSPFGTAPTLGLPVGTAIYTGATDAWYEGAWPLWTHVVRHVDGCVGIGGGRVIEPVGGMEGGYMVYVAWRSVAHHDDYHHTKHFAKHRVILQIGHRGYAEYGHVVFRGVREGQRAVKGKL
ncbi:hypothetical protein Micbo1qcDRAFT_206629 [Microdochium bolleyi]|uniref:ABM domain-containing protein n=1 Tax=Microdochium bolleyi TaxID=196109 RepID=A0A136IW90_9PEZI|nr:hypothetical protein Micbo1qcDRAFT_206629 [Microdochium bolleyi]